MAFSLLMMAAVALAGILGGWLVAVSRLLAKD